MFVFRISRISDYEEWNVSEVGDSVELHRKVKYSTHFQYNEMDLLLPDIDDDLLVFGVVESVDGLHGLQHHVAEHQTRNHHEGTDYS